MPRIRTIKPTHWNDKELTTISLQAHLLWIGTWNFSDDEGVFENDPFLIRSQIFPRRTDIRTEQVSTWLDQLVKARFIIPFTHQGIGYYIHRTFKAHQKIDRPQPSKIPESVIRGIFDESSSNVQPCIVLEGNVKESKGPPPAANPPTPPSVTKSESITEIILKSFTADFLPVWQKWKDYKLKEFKYKFKSDESEKANFTGLLKKSEGDEKVAIAIINQSMESGWKGLFELKESLNQVVTAKEVTQKITEVHVGKIEKEISYYYDQYKEDPSKVTVISLDEVYYNTLKKAGKISFKDDEVRQIRTASVKYLEEQKLEGTDGNILKYMKKFGVIEFFKQSKHGGLQSIF